MHTKNKTVTGQSNASDEFTYDDEHADSLDCPYRMIYTTVAENGAEEKHSVGCDDLADALDLARNIYPDATLFGHNPIDITVGGEVVAQIVENQPPPTPTAPTDRLEQIMAERNVLLNALQRISESVICWQDDEANALLEGVGIVANNAINKVFQMEGMNQ
jgi:hypothetical protein